MDTTKTNKKVCPACTGHGGVWTGHGDATQCDVCDGYGYFVTTHEAGTGFACVCGNTPDSDGFFSCDTNGNEMEPTLESSWNGLYVCARCGQLHREA